ncbi:MAG: DEAD/DEAH box helicase [Chlamydiales bacterium]|nr:DEAD/DEAH box helicase [Chlamydiales bacterium]
MHIPDFLEPYKVAGQKLLTVGAVKGLVFSGPTYQVEIQDPTLTDALWVFLQFDENEEIKDLFCSCEESSEKGACSHMAAACYYVYRKKNKPQHVRFEASFWHHFFLKMQEDVAPRKPKVIKKANSIELATEEGKTLLRVTGKGKPFDDFANLVQAKPEETEETSIKFSSLSEDELDRWRQGRPSLRLRYELSFFSDIAKWFFSLQEEGEKVAVTFSSEKGLPEQMEVTYSTITLDAKLDLLPLIPTLNTIEGNLRLLEESEFSLEQIEFDAKTGTFTFHSNTKTLQKPKVGATYGSWQYFPGSGFLSLTHEPKSKVIKKEKEEIIRLFAESLPLLKKHLTVPIVEEPQEVHYHIYFDAKSRLHVQAYLRTHDDLENTHVWGDYAYIDKKFVKLASRKFEDLHFVVSKDELSNFLMANRLWLGQTAGFHVHVAKLEEQILYEVDQNGALTFRSVLQKLPGTKKTMDLGDWLYVEGDGFYVKNFSEDNPPLSFGRQIPRHLVAEYIRHHLDLLQAVPDFFAQENPIKSVGLKIALKKKGTIEILPEYVWEVAQDANTSFFYDEFVYVPEKGFYRLPPAFRPEHLTREITSLDPQAWADFFQELLPKLKSEYQCTVDSRLEKIEELALTVSPKEKAENKKPMRLADWALDVSWQSQNGSISMKDMVSAKKRQERFLPTDAGVIDLTEERFRWLDTIKDRPKTKGDTEFSLNPAEFLRVTAYDTIHVDTQGRKTSENFKQLLERLLVQKPTEDVTLSSLQCDLRPYQKHGVDWLWFLYQNDLSGLLCDDMGVGKTHQAMGLMDGVKNFQKKNGKKSLFLVVCPTSLVYHWQDKLERFLPDFKTKVFIGIGRNLDDFEGDYDVLLTSYGIWRNESKKFAQYFFDAAFFDELQIAKNHVSQIHSALLQVNALLKVGLTGTPIENHLRELKALFDLVLPGYMPPDADFREFFMRPIEREDSKRKELLSRFVRPFVLRRRKCDVLPDLPVKTEDFAYAHLAPEQKTLYKTVASQQAQPLIRQLRDEGSPIPYMHIFAVLSALKQICNHPAAYLKDVDNYEAYESGKWEAFVELIEEAMESEQKVVVFSQFLAMLDIIELFLKKRKIGYAQIRGQTKNRGDEVHRFHNDPNCKIFLGSLQAAGLGIDLTPASIVIHYDRWWNAARENQATDRVHRIGQVRGVQVFKLLTKATIEERIDQLISRKASLLEDVVFFDDHQIVKRLSRQEIISLLEGLPEE